MFWSDLCNCYCNGRQPASDSDAADATEPRVAYRPKQGDSAQGQAVFFELSTNTNDRPKSIKPDAEARADSRLTTNAPNNATDVDDDPLPGMIRATLRTRSEHDLLLFVVNSLLLFALHSTSVFTAAQPYFEVSSWKWTTEHEQHFILNCH